MGRSYIQGKDIPLDPWGRPYRYVRLGKETPGDCNIISAGPDGVFGTKDDIDMNGW